MSVKELLSYLRELRKDSIRNFIEMGAFNLSGLANLLDAHILSNECISQKTVKYLKKYRKFISGVLPLCRLLEFFQRINNGQYRDIRSICGWDFKVGHFIEPSMGNNHRLPDNKLWAVKASAMRKKLKALREKVKSLPQWLELLNGFENVNEPTEVQNFLQELEKVVGRKFPKFLHILSDFVFCSKSSDMTDTVRGAILELCDYFAQNQLNQ